MAVARKLAVTRHRVWREETDVIWSNKAAAV
jgi:hypothetical protein